MAVVSLATAGFGCGGGQTAADMGELAAITTTSLDKSTYIKRAIAVCQRAGKKLAPAIFASPSPHQSASELFEGLGDSVLVPTIERELRELHELGAPRGDGDEVEGILRALQRGINGAKKRRITSVESFGLGFRQFDRLVVDYGLSRCAFFLA